MKVCYSDPGRPTYIIAVQSKCWDFFWKEISVIVVCQFRKVELKCKIWESCKIMCTRRPTWRSDVVVEVKLNCFVQTNTIICHLMLVRLWGEVDYKAKHIEENFWPISLFPDHIRRQWSHLYACAHTVASACYRMLLNLRERQRCEYGDLKCEILTFIHLKSLYSLLTISWGITLSYIAGS